MEEPRKEIREEDIIIVGAGVAGLTTALGLHRLGLRSLVLESSDSLRITGFALTLWTNAWRALDAVGLGDSLRQRSLRLQGFSKLSVDSGLSSSEASAQENVKFGNHESRCVIRRDLLEALLEALPQGTVRYSSEVVSIEEAGLFKLVHLTDGSVLKTKVFIGCDGVNSVVAKWLGLQNPVNSGRSAIRGLAEFPDGHGFEPNLYAHFGGGARFGFVPCDDKNVYWFCTFTPSANKLDNDMEQNPTKIKQFVLSKIANAPKEASNVVETTELSRISFASLKLRLPWNLLTGNIVKSNVCLAGDALHPMTPDIGQGGCSSLEDGVILARCLGEASLKKQKAENRERSDQEEYEMIKKGLENYAKERRWRSFSLISTAYLAGFVQQGDGKVMNFLGEKWLAKYTGGTFLRMADFDCGKLVIP